MPEPAPIRSASQLVRTEAEALTTLADRLSGGEQLAAFQSLSEHLAGVSADGHNIVLTGVGKSGLIARKIAATMVSTGTRALFLHPADALHGDLGLLRPGDALLALSYSGETEELLRLLPVLPRLQATLACFTGTLRSTLGCASRFALDVSVASEACDHQLAPTASTTAMLALGDALAIDLSRRLRFEPRDFAELHPGGHLGRRLAAVHTLMHSGEAVPTVAPTATLPEVIHEISAKRLGMATVQQAGQLLGIVSDGDLRRLFEAAGPAAFHRTAAEILRPSPRTIAPGALAAEALERMEQHKITALLVTQDGTPATAVLGVLHLHDILS